MTRVYVGGLSDRANERELDDEVRKGVKKSCKENKGGDGGQAVFPFLCQPPFLFRPLPKTPTPVRPLRPHQQHLDRA